MFVWILTLYFGGFSKSMLQVKFMKKFKWLICRFGLVLSLAGQNVVNGLKFLLIINQRQEYRVDQWQCYIILPQLDELFWWPASEQNICLFYHAPYSSLNTRTSHGKYIELSYNILRPGRKPVSGPEPVPVPVIYGPNYWSWSRSFLVPMIDSSVSILVPVLVPVAVPVPWLGYWNIHIKNAHKTS